MEAGQVSCVMAPFDVASTVKLACKIFEAEIINRSLVLELDLAAVEGMTVVGDSDRLSQVLMYVSINNTNIIAT